MAQPYTDKELRCVECGEDFTFSAQQQEKFVELGFTNEPKRCPPCRAAKKTAKGEGPRGAGPAAAREFHVAKCASCGGEARVPFKPRGDKPVYCSSCFQKRL
jgi:CxxC-x17-CxxC domain-containing protein